MKRNIKLLLIIVGLTLAIFLLILVLLRVYGRPDLMTSIGVGYGVSLFNNGTSFFYLNWALHKSNKIFFRTVISGMVFRFAIIGGALFWVWNFSNLNQVAFVASMILFYLIIQIFEIYFIYHELKIKR